MTETRKLRVFLCHASQDKAAVNELFYKLAVEGWIDPWFDKVKLLPGQSWEDVIERAVEDSDAVIVCLSNNSVNKEGFVQKELRYALATALEKPEGTIFILPIRLEECKVPRSLRDIQWIDYFGIERENTYVSLLQSLMLRFQQIVTTRLTAGGNLIYQFGDLDFVKIPAGKFWMGDNSIPNSSPQHELDIIYDYWMGRFPITNQQYALFRSSVGGSHTFKANMELHPVTNLTWTQAQDYIQWLNDVRRDDLPRGYMFCLPSDAEWEKAARGTDARIYPWGNEFDKRKCNVWGSGAFTTTPVGLYSPQGDSPYGASDMSGNIIEWTRTMWHRNGALTMPWKYFSPEFKYPYRVDDGREVYDVHNVSIFSNMTIRGGSYFLPHSWARIPYRRWIVVGGSSGFRLVVKPKLS